MPSMITQPQLLTAAAENISQISSAINQAKAAAAGPTTSLVAAAQDEVSAVTAQFFGTFGQEYQALLSQATAFHDQFTAALAAAGNVYAQTESEIASSLGLGGGATANPVFGAVTQAAGPAVSQILFMGDSGTPNPPPSYVQSVYSLFMSNYTPNASALSPFFNAVTTAEGLYPFNGTKDLTLDISLPRGVTSLDTAISNAFSGGATSLGVFGYSQSAIVASMAMPQLHSTYSQGELFFTLVGDPSAPNGGLFARFPDLSLPSMGITFGTSTPADLFQTSVYTLEYDGFADFPQYPIDFLSDLNALAGIVYVHGNYPTLTSLSGMFTLPTSGTTMTTYYMIPTANLPLLDPLRAIPVIGNPLADLMQPDLTYLVNWGYGDPAYGFSTGPANIQTPFGFLPPLSATTALGPDLISGTQAGINAFVGDVSAMVPTSPPSLSLPNLSLSSLTGALSGALGGTGTLALPSLTSIISDIQSANTNIVGTLTTDFSTAYATLLPTADIATAVVISLPSYDVNLFLNGITQAINGQPLQGLMNAIGDPIAANIGLTTLAGGFEFISIENSLETILTGAPNPSVD